MAKLISIIIPVYNEENTIKIILNKVLKQNNFDKEIIVINDSSTDNTKSLIEEFFLSKIKLINNEKNYGKGFSVKRGIEVASGDIILIQDGDLEYDPSDYEKILKPIIENRADVVFGSRFLGSGEKRVLFFWHRIGNYLLTLFSNALTNLNLTDMEVGYKAFKKEVLANIVLEENRFGFEPEITAKIAKKKLKIF